MVLCVMGAWIFFALETNKAATMINSLDQQVAQRLADIEDCFISLENSTWQIANYCNSNTQSLDQLFVQHISNFEDRFLSLDSRLQLYTKFGQLGQHQNFSSIDNFLLHCTSGVFSCLAPPPLATTASGLPMVLLCMHMCTAK